VYTKVPAADSPQEKSKKGNSVIVDNNNYYNDMWRKQRKLISACDLLMRPLYYDFYYNLVHR